MGQPLAGPMSFLRSIVAKNILLFLLIMLVAMLPLAVRYDQDSRDYEIQTLASKLEFFAQRGASWIDIAAVETIRKPADKDTAGYRTLLATLQRIEREFGVDNAVVMRREDDGGYSYVAVGHDGFTIGERAGIHTLFPATYKATDDTWRAGDMMHSQLFGGTVDGTEYDQFLQINTPLKRADTVVAILMLNKFANPVAAAVRAKTLRVVALSSGLLAAGLVLFAFVSSRMLRPLKQLTAAAGQVAEGNLSITLPPVLGRDEVGQLSLAFHGMLDGLRQRDFIRDTFGRYVTREVVDEILGSPDGLKLGGETRLVTILVSDLRGFTALASTLSPNTVLSILNRFLEGMVAVLQRHRGTIDEIQGDGILAFFGALVAAPDDALRAVACAVEMQLALREFNTEQRRLGLPELAMGVAINTGEVVIGNIGSERRTKYGAVGTAINTTYRIESETVGGQILVGAETYERVRGIAQVRGSVTVEFKGLDRPVTLYDVTGVAGDYELLLPDAADELLVPVRPALAVTCFLLDGNTISSTPIAARLVGLGAAGADIAPEQPIAERADLKVLLPAAGSHGAHEMFGKVMQKNGDDTLRIAFTSLSDSAKAHVAGLIRDARHAVG